MITIANGGQLEKFDQNKLRSIRIDPGQSKRMYELWLNEDSVSYLTLQELLDLRDEINDVIKDTIL